MCSISEPIDAMAASMRVQRWAGEAYRSYCARVAYACVRPWVWAYCVDDGANGSIGIGKQALNARLKRWVTSMDNLYPGLRSWFGVEGGGLSLSYNRLIDVDDIIEAGFSGRYMVHKPVLVSLDGEYSVAIGAFEITDSSAYVCGERVGSTLTTGLCTLVRYPGGTLEPVPPFWETDAATMKWCRAADVGAVDYIDLTSRRWGLRSSESWRDKPMWSDGISIARLRAVGYGPNRYFMARRARGGVEFAELEWYRATELWLHLRAMADRAIRVRVKSLDNHHVMLDGIPLMLLPGTCGRYLDAMTWPLEAIDDWSVRVARKEALPTIRNLLEKCAVALQEV